MTEGRVQRRLAAILAADIVGYSRLMGFDEVGTLEALKAHRREVVDPAIAEHNGRIVKTTGDGMLVEFASVVDAVACAMAVQAKMGPRNEGADVKINFRIGINVGDIIIDGNDIFGDGVNVAARVEGECEPGGVCLSGSAFDQVRGKIGFAFEDIGERSLKNIDRPVRLYAVRQSGAPVATPHSETAVKSLPLPDKPSIAVLPFQNMSGDPEQEYLADGMVEDIITALSRFRSLFVIARNSSFTYKGKAVDIKQVGLELGVRYVLEGSVRKSGNRLRITGQLIDAISGAHLWADRFDGVIEDIFELQDKVTQQVVGAIHPEIEKAEMERASHRPIGNIDAVTECWRGVSQIYWPTSPENNDKALHHFRNAIAIDPRYAPAYSCAAMSLMWRRSNGWPADGTADDAELLSCFERVKELRTDDAVTLTGVGFALFFNRVNFEAGIELVDRAIGLNPNCAGAYIARGYFRVWDGGSDDAIADFEKAMRLSPRGPFAYNCIIGIAQGHYHAGRYIEGAKWADKFVTEFPYFIAGLRGAILCYVGAARLDDAKKALGEILRLRPNLTLSTMPPGGFRSAKLIREVREALLMAGLPE